MSPALAGKFFIISTTEKPPVYSRCRQILLIPHIDIPRKVIFIKSESINTLVAARGTRLGMGDGEFMFNGDGVSVKEGENLGDG